MAQVEGGMGTMVLGDISALTMPLLQVVAGTMPQSNDRENLSRDCTILQLRAQRLSASGSPLYRINMSSSCKGALLQAIRSV